MFRLRPLGFAGLMAILSLLVACSGSSSPPPTARVTTSPTAGVQATTAASAAASPMVTAAPLTGRISVFAASSLTESFKAIGAKFKEANPAVEVEFNFAASSVLATQIEQAAPADVFASADQPQMQRLVDKGLIDGQPAVFARNLPVVVIPAENPGKVQGVRDLGRPGLKLVLAGPDVPIGNYARQIIDKLAGDPAYGESFKTAALGNIVSNESNVRGVLTKVELGEADAGVVYKTDALVSGGKVKTVAIPDAANVIATYPVAVVKTSANAAVANAFVAFLRSAAGQKLLQDAGFDNP